MTNGGGPEHGWGVASETQVHEKRDQDAKPIEEKKPASPPSATTEKNKSGPSTGVVRP